MVILDSLAKQAGGTMDFTRFFPRGLLKNLGKALSQAGMKTAPKEYASFSALAALAATMFAIIAILAANAPLEALAATPLFFAGALALILNAPFSRSRKRAALVERDLAIALRTMSVELAIGVPFERALKSIAKNTRGELSAELRRVASDVESGGAAVGDALKAFANRVDSMLAKRAAMQLAFTYEQGLGSEGLRKLADELTAAQKQKAKEYSAKMAFFGLAFIAVSCIAPALFSAYVIVGSSFMELLFSPAQIAAAFTVGFPAADLAILWYLKSNAPAVLGF